MLMIILPPLSTLYKGNPVSFPWHLSAPYKVILHSCAASSKKVSNVTSCCRSFDMTMTFSTFFYLFPGFWGFFEIPLFFPVWKRFSYFVFQLSVIFPDAGNPVFRYDNDSGHYTLFSKRSAHWFTPVFPVTLGHWPQPRVMSILSNGLDSNMQKTPFKN